MISEKFLYDYPICDLELVKENRKEKVSCIIDTGSPYTIIPLNYIDKLNFDEDEQFTKVTIHGIIHKDECSVDVPGYEIDIRIGELFFKNSTIFCYEFLNEYGLLGHNILNQCNLIIDWKKKRVIIEKL